MQPHHTLTSLRELVLSFRNLQAEGAPSAVLDAVMDAIGKASDLWVDAGAPILEEEAPVWATVELMGHQVRRGRVSHEHGLVKVVSPAYRVRSEGGVSEIPAKTSWHGKGAIHTISEQDEGTVLEGVVKRESGWGMVLDPGGVWHDPRTETLRRDEEDVHDADTADFPHESARGEE